MNWLSEVGIIWMMVLFYMKMQSVEIYCLPFLRHWKGKLAKTDLLRNPADHVASGRVFAMSHLSIFSSERLRQMFSLRTLVYKLLGVKGHVTSQYGKRK